MMFGLKTAPATFQRTITDIIGDYIPTFMQVFLDDFAVYGTRGQHLGHLQLCLERCHTSRLSDNPAKCAFGVVDPNKIMAIIEAKSPTNAKALSHFLGQIR